MERSLIFAIFLCPYTLLYTTSCLLGVVKVQSKSTDPIQFFWILWIDWIGLDPLLENWKYWIGFAFGGCVYRSKPIQLVYMYFLKIVARFCVIGGRGSLVIVILFIWDLTTSYFDLFCQIANLKILKFSGRYIANLPYWLPFFLIQLDRTETDPIQHLIGLDW